MSSIVDGFNTLGFFDITSTQFIIPIVFILCIGCVAYDWIKRTYRNLPRGPRGLPFVGYRPFLGGQPFKALAEHGKKYGHLFGLYMGSKYTVFLTEYNVMKEILNQNASLDRSESVFSFVPGGMGISSVNGEEWQEQRRFCMQAMRDLGLGKGPWENLIHEEVQEFVDSLDKHKGRPMDISYLLSSSVNNNIISLLIGRKLRKGVDDEKIKELVEMSDVTLVKSDTYDPATYFPWLRKYLAKLKIGGHHEVDTVLEKFTKFVMNERKLHQSSEELKEREDFINMYQKELIRGNSAEKGHRYFTENNLLGNMKSLFLGASDTSSSSLHWIFMLMAAHQDIQRKIHAEIDDAIGREIRIDYDDRRNIPYTMAVIMETLRFAVVVPMAGARCAREDMKIRGYTIPKGTDIVSNIWALHNDSNYWEHPEKFNPERFLSEDRKEVIKRKSYAPFTMGKRNCPGETVAYMEIFLYFTAVMQKFEVKPLQGKKIKFDYDYALVCHLKPQDLCFVERT